MWTMKGWSLAVSLLGFVIVVGATILNARKGPLEFTTGFNGENPDVKEYDRRTQQLTWQVLLGGSLQMLGTVMAYLID